MNLHQVEIIPAILTNDTEVLNQQLDQVIRFAPKVHFDLATGDFVPNTTVGLEKLISFKIPIKSEVHILVNNPQPFLEQALHDGFESIFVHLETIADHNRFIEQFVKPNPKVGLAINPETSLEILGAWHNLEIKIMIMGVHPGFQGHPFLPQTTERVRQVHKLIPNARITVDGGVNATNIGELVVCGANSLVVGSAIWKTVDPEKAYKELLNLAADPAIDL